VSGHIRPTLYLSLTCSLGAATSAPLEFACLMMTFCGISLLFFVAWLTFAPSRSQVIARDNLSEYRAFMRDVPALGDPTNMAKIRLVGRPLSFVPAPRQPDSRS